MPFLYGKCVFTVFWIFSARFYDWCVKLRPGKGKRNTSWAHVIESTVHMFCNSKVL